MRPSVKVAESLSDADLNGVAGGMKWTPGTKNNDVIDARGGQAQILFWNVTFDVNGKVSSITPK
jgi:hypothetical protein